MSSSFHLEPDPYPDFSLVDEDTYLDQLYARFKNDLVEQEIVWPNSSLLISFRRQREIGGRHASFWHAVSSGDEADEANRQLNVERCRRICWVKPIIDEFRRNYPSNHSVKWWGSPRPGHPNRILLAMPTFEYVAIFDIRAKYVLFVTAYYVEYPRRRKSLRNEYEAYWRNKGRPNIGRP